MKAEKDSCIQKKITLSVTALQLIKPGDL